MISLCDRAERDDFRSTRHGLRAWWFTKLGNGDTHRYNVYFQLPGTIVCSREFMSPKRWTCGFFFLKQKFTMSQEEMLAQVVLYVQDNIDTRLAHDAAMQKVFDDAWQGPKEVPEGYDDTAQMAAAAFVGGSMLLRDDPPE